MRTLSGDGAEASFETAWQASLQAPSGKSGKSLPLTGKTLPLHSQYQLDSVPDGLTSFSASSASLDSQIGLFAQTSQNLPVDSKPLLATPLHADTTTLQQFLSVEDLSRAIIATSTPATAVAETVRSAVAPTQKLLDESASAAGRAAPLIDSVAFSRPLNTRSPDNDQANLTSPTSHGITVANHAGKSDTPFDANREPKSTLVGADKLASLPIENPIRRNYSSDDVQHDGILIEPASITNSGATLQSQRSAVEEVTVHGAFGQQVGPIPPNASLNSDGRATNSAPVLADAAVPDQSDASLRQALNAIRNLQSAAPNDTQLSGSESVSNGLFREAPKTVLSGESAVSLENRQAGNPALKLSEAGVVEGRPLASPAMPSGIPSHASVVDRDHQAGLADPQRALPLDTSAKVPNIESRLLLADSAIQGISTNVSDRLFRVSRLDGSSTAVTEELAEKADRLAQQPIVRKPDSLAPATVRGPFGNSQPVNPLGLSLVQLNNTQASADSLPAIPNATAGQSAIDLSDDQRIPSDRPSSGPIAASLNGRGEIEVMIGRADGQDQNAVMGERKTAQILSTNQDSPLLVRDLGGLRAPVTDLSGRVQTAGGLPTSPLAASAPQLPEQIGERVVIAAAGQLGKAEIRLTPQGMGSIQIDIQYTDDGASVQLQAVNAQARELLEAGLPRLREMLDNAGIRLNDAAVSQGGADQRGNESGKSADGERAHAGRSPTSSADGPVTESDIEQKPKARQNSVIDTYV